MVQLTEAEIEATPDFGGAPDTQYILGLATIQGGVKTLLNIEKIFLEDGSSLLQIDETGSAERNTLLEQKIVALLVCN